MKTLRFRSHVRSSITLALFALLLASPLAGLAQSDVTITRIVPNDDSVLVEFKAVPGAIDYRIYNVAHPNEMKYAGETIYYRLIAPSSPLPDYSHYSIEWNGVDVNNGATLVVEALDRLGPFKPPMADCHCSFMPLNGQGDPLNQPVVIARSAPFSVYCQPRSSTGSQVWAENFRNVSAFVATGNNPHTPGGWFESTGEYREWDNGRMLFSAYGSDLSKTFPFVAHDHFMEVLADNGTFTDASTVLRPKQSFDISGGRTLHASFEVDAHFTGRRWCDVVVTRTGDPLMNPGILPNGLFPTVSGDQFRWEIKDLRHFAQVFHAGVPTEVGYIDWADYDACARIYWDYFTPLSNGTMLDVDKRHRFDLYLSTTAFRFEERDPFGRLVNVQQRAFPAGAELPFDRCDVHFVHQVYHTGMEHEEFVRDNAPNYWQNETPNADQRHWDNLLVEVLGDASNQPPTVNGITLNPNAVVGGTAATGKITLSAAAPEGGLSVALASDKTQVDVPGNVTVTAGATSATFAVNTSASTSDVIGTVTATVNGGSASAPITVTSNTSGASPKILSVKLSATSLVGGESATGLVTLGGQAPAGGTTVTLYTSTAAANVPASVTVTAGASTATFSITSAPTASISTGLVNATLSGVKKTAKLNVNPPAIFAMSLSPAKIATGQTSTCTLKLTGAAPASFTISLRTSNTTAAPVPEQVTFTAGSTTATFTIKGGAVSATTTATILASDPALTSKSAKLTVKT